jgi:hypothetical protein
LDLGADEDAMRDSLACVCVAEAFEATASFDVRRVNREGAGFDSFCGVAVRRREKDGEAEEGEEEEGAYEGVYNDDDDESA